MKAIKQVLASALLAGSVVTGNVAHAGIPVIDSANLAQAIAQVNAWAQQYQQMVAQINEIRQQYAALTGTRNLGELFNNPLLQASVPADVGAVFSAVAQIGFSGLTAQARALRTQTMLYNCADRTGADQTRCQAVLDANSQTITYLNNALPLITQRVAEIQKLQDQINSTMDPKGIAELQASLQAENTQVSNDANRLAIMQKLADEQQKQAEQTLHEQTLTMLSPGTATAASTFAYTAP